MIRCRKRWQKAVRKHFQQQPAVKPQINAGTKHLAQHSAKRQKKERTSVLLSLRFLSVLHSTFMKNHCATHRNRKTIQPQQPKQELAEDTCKKMVGAERFELPTPWSQTRCATRLRYAPTKTALYTNIDTILLSSAMVFGTDGKMLLFSIIQRRGRHATAAQLNAAPLP